MNAAKKILIILFAALNILSYGQTKSVQISPKLSEGKASDVGISPERLARIDSMCVEIVREGHLPGIVTLVSRKGKIVLHKAYGTSKAATKKQLRKDDIFRLASQSKAITATAVMMLWEQGKFRLDDPLSKYIPELKILKF